MFLSNRGRKLSFKFLSVEVERVLLSIIRACEGGGGGEDEYKNERI